MKPWRCQICGETYLGDNSVDRCPFCGAEGEYLKSAAHYLDYGVVEMSEQSRKDCLHALDLENDNTVFYSKCTEAAENQISKAIFKRLGKQEAEHAELLEDMLGEVEVEMPDPDIPDNDFDRFAEANKHEKRAINFYLEVAKRAPEPRVQQVFRALSDIETEHLTMANTYK
ncbi:MAG: ferritin-like domain-containing protein [Halanaerobiales bacterium]|nr:ferritin-like domain-containing protein [Halanaerobiales bacterium]